VILALRLWMGVLALVMLAYAIRHLLSTITRVGRQQRTGDAALLDQVCPGISVLIPMHDDEAVAEGVLTALVQSDYPKERLEIIPIDDHSQDATPEILERYRAAHPFIKPVYRRSGPRGKPAALNDALALASHEIVIVFDAGHLPTRGVLRELARAFQDPEVGGVVGRVFPRNTSALVLTRLLEPERAGGHQVDQQARYTLDPISRFGGTMGGFRRSLALAWGGFDPRVLAEDCCRTPRSAPF
jgi:cellulose synthase/poly-beta-1,6-N-acetylglucosamine synthase-like glycosyltransferase